MLAARRLCVSCELACSTLHGYFDRELSAAGAVEFERHLEHCSDCLAELDACDAVRDSLQSSRLYAHAPALLRQKIRTDLRSLARATASSQLLPRRLLAAAALFLVALIVSRFMPGLHTEEDYQAEFAAGIVDAHLRSLLPGQITIVNSSDPHTVRAWFDEKVKFAFPVSDFAAHGFSLQGGRVDVVQGRTVAALVYASKGHLVNVFAWPTNETDTSPRTGSRQGYQWIDWRKGNIEFCAVSDASASDLQELPEFFTE
jgi:anti-sigma factor (TIGR02949 family)